jgi:hypothetical protein
MTFFLLKDEFHVDFDLGVDGSVCWKNVEREKCRKKWGKNVERKNIEREKYRRGKMSKGKISKGKNVEK